MLEQVPETREKQAEELYQNEVVQIQLFKGLDVLQLTFKSQPNTDQFRNAYNLAIGAALSKGVKYWLTDARKINQMLPENQLWLKQQMGPLFQSVLKKFAILMAPECFVMTNPDKVYNKPAAATDSPVSGKIKVLFDREEALKWLLSPE